MSFSMKLKVTTPLGEIEGKMLKAISKHLNIKLKNIEKDLTFSVYNLMYQALTGSQETQSIISGQLKSELGIVDADAQLSEIFKAIVHATEVTITKARVKAKGVSMTLRISAVPFDLSSMGSIGSYRTEKGTTIPWFEWLTSLGDRVIVRDYEIEAGHPKHSRTGDAIMISGRKGWRVPPQFAGTKSDNFVTRAVDGILPPLEKIIIKKVQDKI